MRSVAESWAATTSRQAWPATDRCAADFDEVRDSCSVIR